MGTIPGPFGWPLIGNLPQLLPNPLPYLKRCHAEYGNIFYAGFAFNQRSVLLLSPDATERALIDRDGSFSSKLGYTGLSNFIGEGAVLFRDGDDHRKVRQIMNDAFKPAALTRYLNSMNTRIGEAVARWSNKGAPDDVAKDVRLLSLDIAAEVIAGARLNRDAGFISQHFVNMLDAMTSPIPAIPGTARWTGLRSRGQLDQFFRTQIDERRGAEANDLFSTICRNASEVDLDDDAITDNMLGLLVASYETTASAVAMMIYELARNPEWQTRVRREILKTFGSEPTVGRSQLDQLVETTWVFNETLRLHPPLSYFPRRTTKAIEIEGHVIPPNTNVTIAPAFVHQLASFYREPERFDPTRFSPERAEDKAHTCAFIPFGKGSHTCIGMHFARMEALTFFVHLLLRFQIESIGTEPLRLHYVPVLRPAGRMSVRLVPISV
jgi:cytochrome P450